MSSFSAAVTFDKKFNSIEKVIPFNASFNNGTDYYNGAVEGLDAPVLAVGEFAKCVSPMPNNRRMIFVGTPVGSVVVFERYTDGASGVHVTNQSRDLERTNLIVNGKVSDEQMTFILGGEYSFEKNIGEFLQNIKNVFNNTSNDE